MGNVTNHENAAPVNDFTEKLARLTDDQLAEVEAEVNMLLARQAAKATSVREA